VHSRGDGSLRREGERVIAREEEGIEQAAEIVNFISSRRRRDRKMPRREIVSSASIPWVGLMSGKR